MPMVELGQPRDGASRTQVALGGGVKQQLGLLLVPLMGASKAETLVFKVWSWLLVGVLLIC